jgi:hypothetical protein
MSKTPSIVVDSGELYVFGKLISRHPDFPWLFSITDVYKACEKSIKREALRKGKKPETYFKTREPGQWIRTKDEHGIKRSAVATRKRLLKHGISCGFGQESTVRPGISVNLSSSTDMRPGISVNLYTISDRDMVIKIVKGGSTRGANKTVQGTYVCQNWIVQYASFLNESLSEEITNTFVSVLNGYTEEVTKKVEKNENRAKGTQARADNIEFNHRLVEACGLKKLLPMHVQRGINEGVLGMTATKYKKLHDIKEPFNDNLTEDQVDIKNAGIAFATLEVRNHPKSKLSPKEGQEIGKASGAQAQFIRSNRELSKFVQENQEAVRQLMENYR